MQSKAIYCEVQSGLSDLFSLRVILKIWAIVTSGEPGGMVKSFHVLSQGIMVRVRVPQSRDYYGVASILEAFCKDLSNESLET